ncbi:MAG: S8 family serine peptidase [Candidatus Gastranaerophilales bacterium]|nr:S8 family serine peptidase [Candidatus Gastranaerophilales bacterium]
MKKILLFFVFIVFAELFCIAQIAKKKPISVQKDSISNVTTFRVDELPDRSKLNKLSENNYNFDLKKKVTIDDEKHWYAVENASNETYWNNVNCKKIIIELQKNYTLENGIIKDFLQKHSLTLVVEKSMFPELQNFYVFEVPNADKNKVLSIVENAKELGIILYAEPVGIFKQSSCEPNDPYYYSQQWGPYVIMADSVWCYFTGGSNNWLAIIDESVDWYHEDLYNTVWYGYDFAMNDSDPSPEVGQEHGTHVSGTVGATINNGLGVAGILNDTIYFAKVSTSSGELSDAAIVNALNYIATIPQVRVINMSFGDEAPSSALETALQNAYNNGKLLIAAAGNDATSSPRYPAAYSIVISVSAVGVDAGGYLIDASYSNYGSTIDVSAPGGEYSNGFPIISTLPSNNYGGANWQGTSMAAPHVTGVAGLVFAINPLLTNSQARSIIEQQVFDLGSTGWDPLFGSGMVCAWCAFEEACNQLSITVSAGGSTTFCTGGSVTLNAVYNSGLSYQWQKNGINISGANSNSYTVTQAGTYSLHIQTLGGICEAYSNSIVITVNSLPSSAGTISGTTSVCQGQNSVTYSVPTIANATSYIWTLPSGATGSSSTNNITVNYSTSAVSGNITVKGHNTCGVGSTSTLPITVNSLPQNAGSITGTTTVCQGQNSVTYTVLTIPYANSYIWTLPSGASGTSTTNSIVVDFGTTAISGDITVKGTNSCGDGTVSTLPVTVNIKPTTPLITLNGLVLQSDSPNGNLWFNQNGIINGATNQNYTVTVDGDYYVIVSLLGCDSDPSNIINVTVTGIEVVESGRVIKVYPNPVSNELIIEIEGNNGKVDFDILNAIGQIVFKGILVDKTTVQTRDFAPGVYLIKLENGKTFEFKKIIKE